jgi:hypothetical protein
MTYPPTGDAPDPYQPQQPSEPGLDPTTPYSQGPQAAPASGQPGDGQPGAYSPSSYPVPDAGQPGGYPPPPYPTSPGSYAPNPYGPNPYGPSPYGPSPYGPGPYGVQQPYPAYGPQTRTNALAIASLACSLGGLITCLSAPVGIVLGHIARRQIRETGEQGEGMATAGLWVGYILTILGILLIAAWLVAFVVLVNVNDTPA